MKKAQVAIEKTVFSAPNLKAQVAIEFFIYSTLFLFIVILAYVLVNFVQNTEVPEKQSLLVKELGQSFVDSINLAIKGGSGFSYNTSFAKTILGSAYRITVYETAPNSQIFNLLIDANISSSEYNSIYSLPSYKYKFDGNCWDQSGLGHTFNSTTCKNWLSFQNDGENLSLTKNR